MMAVAAAGPLTNLVMAAAGALIIGLLMRGGAPADASPGGFAVLAFTYFVAINVFVAFFNLLPIPPFDGSHIVEGVLPRSWAAQYGKLRGVGMALFFVLVALSWYGPTSGLLGNLIGPPVEWMLGWFDGLIGWVKG
jgi:Zn-dependent protease